VDSNIKKGEKYLAIGEYYDAGEQFKKAYSKTPSKERAKRGEIALKTAYCYEKINATQKAIAAYRNAIRYEKASIEDHLSLGRQLLKIGDYKSAAKEFQIVLDSIPDNILAINGLESAKSSPIWKKKDSGYSIKKQDTFNSRRADFSPTLCGDQYNTLYFTSTRNEATSDELSGITGAKPADIFESKKDDKGKWSKPESVTGGLNSENEEGTSNLSIDGREMYITLCVTDDQYPRYAQIAKSSRNDAAWGKPTVIELTKDTLSNFAHPAISPDGNWIYFVSDMPGGQGDLDIWRARITSNGYGGVENLGPKINTPGKEMFPTFRPNGDLYFSSDGHPGFGGLDIYYVTKGQNNDIEVKHPGYPLNSQGDDFGMTFEGLHNRGYFSSNRADTGRGWDKIYSFEKPEVIQTVKGWVYEQDGFELPEAIVYLVGDDGTNLKLNVKGDGSFEQEITANVNYILLATCTGYLNHKEELKVNIEKESKEHTLQFPLVNISVPTLINNIFYDFDKATLKPESMTALDKLVELLQQNPNITIELSAHCDYRGSAAYNKKLSQARSESVCEYLVKKGINADRLSPKGYGKEKPKTIRKKLTEKYPWMKENDQLTQEYIEKLKPEQQEICNQLNRRTEFVVLRTTYGLFDKDGKLKQNIEKKKTETNLKGDSDFFDFQ
jgi:outer membrane protein OmpA-like peptidoglycan-associated protein